MATYYIDPTGINAVGRTGLSLAQAWATLQYAATRVTTAGNIIHVNAGSYTETLQTLLAVGVSIEGEGNTSIIHSNVGGTSYPASFTIRAESGAQNVPGNQHITNIMMDGNNLTAYGAIAIRYRGNVIISGCTIVNFNYYGVSFINGQPPSTYATGNKFYNNVVTNCSGYFSGNRGCLEIQGQDGMLIYNNNMSADRGGGNSGDVIYAVQGFLKNVKIYNNIFTKTCYAGISSWDFAIEIWNAQGGVEIYNNDITGSIDFVISADKGTSSYVAWVHNNRIGQPALIAKESVRGILIEFTCSDIIVEDNYFHDITQGIFLQQGQRVCTASNIRISYNIFNNIGCLINSKGWGIYWSVEERDDFANNINIWNNVFIASINAFTTMYGIGLPDIGTATNVSVRNNIVVGFDYCPVFGNGNGGTTINILSIENNIFWGNGNSNLVRYVNGMIPTNNTTQNNKIANPLFVSSSDFHLLSTSPAINAGINVGLTTDYAGVVVTNPPDIGAYQYASSPAVPVTSIIVAGTGGATTISTNKGTLQMSTIVLPVNASNKTVTWSLINGSGTGTINSSGLLSALTDGTVTVRATANDGSGVHGDLTITISNQIILVSTITVAGTGGATTISVDKGTLTMIATVLPANAVNKVVTWTVTNNTGTATINSTTGVLSAISNGIVVVRATATDGSGVYGERSITLSNQIMLVTSITVTGNGGVSTITANKGTLQMLVSILPTIASNKTVTWTRTNGTGTATISTTGILSALTDGTVTVRATANDGTGIYGEKLITISGQIISVTNITVTGAGGAITISTNKGTLQMSAAILPINATNKTVTWSVINGSGSATINVSGLLTASRNGIVTVRATSTDGSSVYGDLIITISNQIVLITSIAVTTTGGASTITIPGGALQMIGTIAPVDADNKTYTWSVINGSGTASINGGGLLTALTNGTVTVRATANDISGVYGEKIITISNQVTFITSITVTGAGGATTISTNKGTLQMSTSILPINATNKTITWSVINGSGTASINSSGLLSALTNGNVTVRATAIDGSGIVGNLTITLSNQNVPILVTLITVSGLGNATSIITNRGTLQMLASILPTNATNKNVTWSVVNGTGSASIDSNGLLTAITNGNLTVRATALDGSSIMGSIVIAISNQITYISSITVTGTGGATTISTNGGTLQMLASILPINATNKNVSWSVINGSGSAGINTSGLLTAITNGNVTVRATAIDGSGIMGSIVITISNQTILVTSITVTGLNGITTISTNGGTLQMLVNILPITATNKAIVWSVINGTGSATINGTGLLRALTNGVVTVRATSSDGTGISGTQIITISNQGILVTSIAVNGANGVSTITTKNGTLQMSANVSPTNAANKNVTWSVINGTGSASINSIGLLSAINNGNVTVRATAVDGSGIIGSMIVSISNQVVLVNNINVSGTNGVTTITVRGGKLQLIATISPINASNKKVTWSRINGTGTANISKGGSVTALTNGTVTARATANDGSGVYGEIVITMSNQDFIHVTSLMITGMSTITTDGGKALMSAIVSPTNATNKDVTWSITSGNSLASINKNGTVTALANGKVTVKAVSKDNNSIYGYMIITITNQIMSSGNSIIYFIGGIRYDDTDV